MIEARTIDAFTDVPFGGNAAGVALIEGDYPADSEMLETAKFMGYSETAFVKKLDESTIQLRYFTPAAEVDLCGHATVGSFFGLYKWGMIEIGKPYKALTKAGEINVDVSENGVVWMDMATPADMGGMNDKDTEALYAMYGLSLKDAGELRPYLISTGLPDIMMPVASREILANLKPDMDAISAISEKLHVTGVHVFTLDTDPNAMEAATAHARNFAPLYDIPEEAATGTSNGALTYYLWKRGLIKPGKANLVVQGEAMGRPSDIRTVLYEENGSVKVRVGGRAAIR